MVHVIAVNLGHYQDLRVNVWSDIMSQDKIFADVLFRLIFIDCDPTCNTCNGAANSNCITCFSA